MVETWRPGAKLPPPRKGGICSLVLLAGIALWGLIIAGIIAVLT